MNNIMSSNMSYSLLVAAALLLAVANANPIICASSSSGSDSSNSASGGISGDPHFSGFHGQRFEFNGADGEIYNVFSAPSEQVNARFVANAQWGDSRSFVSALGVAAGTNSQVEISCANATISAYINGQHVAPGAMEVDGSVSVFVSVEKVTVGTPMLSIDVSKAKNQWSSCFLNMDFSLFMNGVSVDEMHGLIGQTARLIDDVAPQNAELTKFHDGVFAIEGSDEDYHVREGHLFGSDFRFNRFVGSTVVRSEARRLLGAARMLLQSECDACINTCDSQPDGMHNCMILNGLPECYDTDVNTFCAPSGCAAGPDCSTDGRTLTMSCGFFTGDAAGCNNAYTELDGPCMDDAGLCSPNPACLPPSSGGSSPSGPADPCSTTGKTEVASCGLNTGNPAACGNSFTALDGACFDDAGICMPNPACMSPGSSSYGGPDPCHNRYTNVGFCGDLTNENDCNKASSGTTVCEWSSTWCSAGQTCTEAQMSEDCSLFNNVAACSGLNGNQYSCETAFEGSNQKCIYLPSANLCFAWPGRTCNP